MSVPITIDDIEYPAYLPTGAPAQVQALLRFNDYVDAYYVQLIDETLDQRISNFLIFDPIGEQWPGTTKIVVLNTLAGYGQPENESWNIRVEVGIWHVTSEPPCDTWSFVISWRPTCPPGERWDPSQGICVPLEPGEDLTWLYAVAGGLIILGIVIGGAKGKAKPGS